MDTKAQCLSVFHEFFWQTMHSLVILTGSTARAALPIRHCGIRTWYKGARNLAAHRCRVLKSTKLPSLIFSYSIFLITGMFGMGNNLLLSATVKHPALDRVNISHFVKTSHLSKCFKKEGIIYCSSILFSYLSFLLLIRGLMFQEIHPA